jgi:hypothetical protein
MFRETPRLLAKSLEIRENGILHLEVSSDYDIVPDLILKVQNYIFLVHFKFMDTIELLHRLALDSRRKARSLKKYQIPLLVVPFMAGPLKEYCLKHDISWLDLSGNAHIKGPGLVIRIGGRPPVKVGGRTFGVFAPNSSRITRQLLMNPEGRISQRRLSHLADVDEGFTSRIVKNLLNTGAIARDSEGQLSVPNPALLLNSWHEAYDFNKHTILKGHIAARSSEELLLKFPRLMKPISMKYAATGLGAAWLYDHFANFRIVTFYLEQRPDEEVLKEFNFIEGDQGANIWLVMPNDEGVFQGSREVDGVICVHPIQVYLDLKGHPERSVEAAESLREHYLKWSLNGR